MKASRSRRTTSTPHLRSRGPVRLPRDYPQRQSAIVRLQLERAGLRLAMLLNGIFR